MSSHEFSFFLSNVPKTFWSPFPRRLLHIDIDMKNLASKMRLVNLSASLSGPTGGACNFTTRAECAFRKKNKKMLHVRFVYVGRTSTDLQILGCELYQNASGGRAPTDLLGSYSAPRDPLAVTGGEEGEEKGNGWQ